MKILYVNGFRGSNTKVKTLENILNIKIDFNLIDYEKDNDYRMIIENMKDYDLIISSSTGSYLARNACERYNIPLISINPVIDIKEVFSRLEVKVPRIPSPEFLVLEELVLLGSRDELIDYKKTIEKLKNKSKIVIKDSDHRFNNLEIASREILNFIKFLYIS